LNLNAITLLTKYARNAFAKQFDNSSHPDQERFGLINLSSTLSLVSVPFFTQYAATKRYDDMFTRAVRDSYLKRNIDSLIVQPSMATTGMTKNMSDPSSCIHEKTSSGSLS